jgi:hypothetical protein
MYLNVGLKQVSKMENAVTKKPIKVLSCGPIKAAVWCDSKIIDDTMVDFHSIKIDKSYKDGDEWKNTNTFNVEDLPKVSVVAMEVYKFLRVKVSENNNVSEQNVFQNKKS